MKVRTPAIPLLVALTTALTGYHCYPTNQVIPSESWVSSSIPGSVFMTPAKSAMIKFGMLEGKNGKVSEGNIVIQDGKLMLMNFKTSEGPDLHIYLTKGQDVTKGVRLGKIDNKSEQTFNLAGVNLENYDSVLIYCDMARVTFGAADLTDKYTDYMRKMMMNTKVKMGLLEGKNGKVSRGRVEIKDGKLMLTNFKTSSGPDLHVYLTKGQDVTRGKRLGKVDLYKSEQTFDLSGVNLEEYDSVLIYCDMARETFGAANLMDKYTSYAGKMFTHTVVKMGMLEGKNEKVSEGKVVIQDGKLMLTNFKTSEGPDLHVYLTKGKDVMRGKRLGKIDLKKSEQTFDLAGVNPEEYDSVLIYCDEAKVTFGATNLTDVYTIDARKMTANAAVKMGMLEGKNEKVSEGNLVIKDGKLMLTSFKTSEGPDLHIYLTKGQDVTKGKRLGKIDLKKSEQTFDLAGVNLEEYDSVLIYCDMARVTFGAADLK